MPEVLTVIRLHQVVLITSTLLGSWLGMQAIHASDCDQMLQHGSVAWQLWLFGALTAPIGIWLWHRQGVHFGLGAGQGQVSRRAAYGSLAACAVLLFVGFVVDGN